MNEKIVYEISISKVSVNEETVDSYGICCKKGDETIALVEDISTNKDAVEKLAEICNDLELSPVQLEDVAEDFIS